jgi:membrane fusion protein (multidrug efflux system)
VKRGDVLFEIDPRPFDTAVAVAKGRLSQAQAQAVKTEQDLKRDRPLAEQHAIAQSQLDTDIAANLAAQASVQSADAEVKAADLNLEFTKVTSLIDGVAAIATAQIGDLVGPQTLLTTVSQLDPIRAYFPLSEQEYLHVADRLNAPSAAGARPWQNGTLTLILAGDVEYQHKGAFLAADRQIDVKTGTIRVSAAFPNPTNTLRPGQFARVRAETRAIDNALLVPQRAVTELQGSFSIRVLGPQNVVTAHQVTVGEQVGARWIVQRGLQAGDEIVVEGPATKDGTTVTPKPYTAPAAAAAGSD